MFALESSLIILLRKEFLPQILSWNPIIS